MTKREYDFAFSLGSACGMTQALRAAGCQFASYPLDWLGSPSLDNSVTAVCNDFAHWMDYDDMRLVEVSHDTGFCTRIYQNDRTQFGFSHEFSDFQRFSETYPKVKASYDRRIERFLELMRSSRRILAVYLERSISSRLSDEQLRRAVALMRAKYPGAVIDLMYIYEDPECQEAKLVSDADGVLIVAVDHRVIEDGYVTQYTKVEAVAAFIRTHVTVLDRRTDEEKAKFVADARKIGSGRWGYDKSAFRRWLNQRAYKLYRHLERLLRKKGLIHPKRQVMFWDEHWKRARGEAV